MTTPTDPLAGMMPWSFEARPIVGSQNLEIVPEHRDGGWGDDLRMSIPTGVSIVTMEWNGPDRMFCNFFNGGSNYFERNNLAAIEAGGGSRSTTFRVSSPANNGTLVFKRQDLGVAGEGVWLSVVIIPIPTANL